jgi:hypothetical protein
LLIQKKENQNKLIAATLQKEDKKNILNAIDKRGILLEKLSKDAWFIGNSAEQRLKEKIERLGKPLKEWDVKIYRGLVTGDNKGLVLDSNEIHEYQDKTFIKPYIFGENIGRYSYVCNKFLIAIPKNTNKNFLSKEFLQKLKQRDEFFSNSISKRKEKGNAWYELRGCNFYHLFKERIIIWTDITDKPKFALNLHEELYIDTSAYFLYTKTPKFILAILNSNLSYFYLRVIASTLGEKSLRWKKVFIEKIPLPYITPSNELLVKRIEDLVDKILAAKKENPQADTSEWEREIDEIVYKLYDLTNEEIKIIEVGNNG